MTEPESWPGEIVAQIVARCVARPERETCGFVVRRGERLQVVEIANVAGADGPPEVAAAAQRREYVMDPVAVLRLHRELAASGGGIAAVWHSHLDGSAALSSRDRADALAGGVEQVPGAEYVVVALRGRTVQEVRCHRLVAGEYVARVLVG